MADSLIKSLPNVTALTQSPSMLDLVLLEQYQSGGDPNVPNNNTYASSSMYLRDFLNSVFQAKGSAGRNRIINGDMRVSQYNGASSVTPTATTYVIDRWNYACTQASIFTLAQNLNSAAGPVGGSSYYLGAQVAATLASPAATDLLMIRQAIEGLNIADLGWGKAGAIGISLSFWVYSSLTGTFGGVLQNSAQNRNYPFTYSIPVANTWTKITITIPGDTSGTWLTTHGVGVYVIFSLCAGSTYLGAAGSWGSTLYFGATGQVNIAATSAATFYATDIQFEAAPFDATSANPVATPFERCDYQSEFARCQRYYQTWLNGDAAATIPAIGHCIATTEAEFTYTYIVPMRVAPSANMPTAVGNLSVFNANLSISYPATTITLVPAATFFRLDLISSTASLVAGNATSLFITPGQAASINFSAEL